MNRSTLIAVLAVVLLIVLISLALRFQRDMAAGRPPQDQSSHTVGEALAKARTKAGSGPIYSILGTGSMAPYLPAGQPDEIVAYAIARPGATFADVRKGNLVVALDPNNPAGATMHQAGAKQGATWILTGLANTRSDTGRMTPDTFLAIVAKTYTWNP